jgi:hypothetical protein
MSRGRKRERLDEAKQHYVKGRSDDLGYLASLGKCSTQTIRRRIRESWEDERHMYQQKQAAIADGLIEPDPDTEPVSPDAPIVKQPISYRLPDQYQERLIAHQAMAIDAQESVQIQTQAIGKLITEFSAMICDPQWNVPELIELEANERLYRDDGRPWTEFDKYNEICKLYTKTANVLQVMAATSQRIMSLQEAAVDEERRATGIDYMQSLDVAMRRVLAAGYTIAELDNTIDVEAA